MTMKRIVLNGPITIELTEAQAGTLLAILGPTFIDRYRKDVERNSASDLSGLIAVVDTNIGTTLDQLRRARQAFEIYQSRVFDPVAYERIRDRLRNESKASS